MKRAQVSILWTVAAAVGCLFVAACSAGSGSRSSRTTPVFGVEEISVQENSVWKINRPIDITFTGDVDFSTVSLNTISIKNLFGEPATGAFQLMSNGRTIRFSPSCPTLDDYSDAGLRPSSTYRLHILGSTTNGLTVLSSEGKGVSLSQSVTFVTPDSQDPLALFLDTVAGPPSVRTRGRGSVGTDSTTATHLEAFEVQDSGEVVAQQVFFRWDTDQQQAFLEANPYLPADPISGATEVPLNLYSQVESQISARVYLDQPVNPASTNINGDLILFEYESSPGNWEAMTTDVELLANCTATGAVLQLTPEGILPQDVGLRINLKQGFQDITGDPTILDTINFASMTVTEANNPVAGAVDDSRSADEILESFAIGGSAAGSMEDRTALFAEPFADWGDGQLKASFDFGGTGGPGGDFSWIVPAGSTRILDSTTDVITGGPNGVPTTSQTVVNGVIDVVDLTVEAGATLIVQGPNPLTILASGTVRIDGDLTVDGSASPGVGTLNTTNQPEPGGSGQAGGGAGGIGSYLTNQSTPRGGIGSGAFNQPGSGGQGGETGFATGSKNNRRGAGGGGGQFGPAVIFPFDNVGTPDLSEDPNVFAQALVGLDGENGYHGGPAGLGAETQTERARGGIIGPSPFFDDNEFNNFLGSKIRSFTVEEAGEPVLQEELVIGELTQLWAGAGGGAGGDAVQSSSFPLVPFNIGGDEKGAGGGGGAGGLRILATGDVIIGVDGNVSADGGPGGGGENTNYFDRVGGGSGGGSGGHIVISTAGAFIIEHAGAPAAGSTLWYNDVTSGSRQRPITALGGQGGAGQQSNGGYNETGATSWRCDAIPFEAFHDVNTGEFVEMPPLDASCFQALDGVGQMAENGIWTDPDNQSVPGAGGDGSPGVIQIHVNDPDTDIVFPDAEVYGQGAAVTRWFAPPPHGWNSPDGIDVMGNATTVNVPPDFMVPFFGRLSKSRSKWVPLGLARVNTGDETVGLQFTGTTAGLVDQDVNDVDLGTSLIGPIAIGGAGDTPAVIGDAMTTMVLSGGGSLVDENEIYRRNPKLLTNLTLLLAEQGDEENNFARYDIIDGSYDAVSNRITVDVAGSTPLALPGVPDDQTMVSLERRDFKVVTNSTTDFLPMETSILVEFQGTVADIDGEPSESAASAFTTDIDDLNLDPGAPGDYVPWDFVRFQVTFDLNALGAMDADLAATPQPGLTFLRIPFSF